MGGGGEPRSSGLEGAVDYFDRRLVKGWAIDRAAPERPVTIEVVSFGRVAAEITTSIFRWDLYRRLGGGGHYGFAFFVPPRLLNTGQGRLDFRFADDGRSLDGAPIEIAPAAERLHAPFETTDPTGRRVLLLAPHPDDEALTCGGSLILHADRGDETKVVFLTDGAEANPGQESRRAYTARRRREAQEACRILGVADVEFWDYPDRGLADAEDALARLCALLDRYRPELVYAPSPLEFHPDHRATAELIWRAVGRTGLSAEVAFYESNRPIHVNRLTNVDAVHERKLRACNVYVSQLEKHPYTEVLDGLSRFRSLTVSPGVGRAEGFFVLGADEIAGRPLDWFTVRQQTPMRERESSDRPLVSVVIRTRDRPATLREALASVLIQSYSNVEVVLVNAGSGDLSATREEFEPYFPVRVVETGTALSRSAAANAGLEAASGQYVNFLDDDDLFYSGHLEKLVGFLERTGERAAYSDCERVWFEWSEGVAKPKEEPTPFDGVDFDRDRLLVANLIPMMTVLFERSLALEAGGFDESLDVLEDWDFWIRASALADFHRVPGVTALYRSFVERPHGMRRDDVHRKHEAEWEARGPEQRERIDVLQAENARLAERLAETRAEVGGLRGTAAWRATARLPRRVLAALRLEGLLEADDAEGAVALEPFDDWRANASEPWFLIDALQKRGQALRDELAREERRLRAARRNPLERLAGKLPAEWLEAAHRARRRVERSRRV